MAIEVKSARDRDSLPGMEEFSRVFKPQIKLLVGGQGISIEDFFAETFRPLVGELITLWPNSEPCDYPIQTVLV